MVKGRGKRTAETAPRLPMPLRTIESPTDLKPPTKSDGHQRVHSEPKAIPNPETVPTNEQLKDLYVDTGSSGKTFADLIPVDLNSDGYDEQSLETPLVNEPEHVTPSISQLPKLNFNPRAKKVRKIDLEDEETMGHATINAASSDSSKTIPPSSSNGVYNPITWARNNLFDSDHHVPLSKDQCQINFAKLTRNPKPLDEQPILELASRCDANDANTADLALAVSMLTKAVNDLNIKIGILSTHTSSFQIGTDEIVTNKAFNLERAKENEELVKLPSGNSFLLSTALVPREVITFTSTKLLENCSTIVRMILFKVAYKDPYFVSFSPTPNPRLYLPVSDKFYELFVGFLIRGFDQVDSPTLRTALTRKISETFTNLVDRLRKKHNATCQNGCIVVANQLKSMIASGQVALAREPLSFTDINPAALKAFAAD